MSVHVHTTTMVYLTRVVGDTVGGAARAVDEIVTLPMNALGTLTNRAAVGEANGGGASWQVEMHSNAVENNDSASPQPSTEQLQALLMHKSTSYPADDTKRLAIPTASDHRVHHAAHYGVERLRMYPWKWVDFVVNVVWVFLLWLVFGSKVPSDGPWLYFHYFTNWMWTSNTIYYTVDLLTYLDYSGTLQFYWLYVAWWPFFGNVCQVFWLVIPLLWMNPRIVVETAEEIGWSATLVGERLVHVLPLVRAWFYLWCRSRDIIDVLRHYWWERPRDRWFFALYVLLMWLGGNLLIAAYCLSYDFHKVYGLDLNVGVAFLMIQVNFALFLVAPILLMSPAGAVMRLYGFKHADEAPVELHEVREARTPPTASAAASRAKGAAMAAGVASSALPPDVILQPVPPDVKRMHCMEYHWLLERALGWM